MLPSYHPKRFEHIMADVVAGRQGSAETHRMRQNVCNCQLFVRRQSALYGFIIQIKSTPPFSHAPHLRLRCTVHARRAQNEAPPLSTTLRSSLASALTLYSHSTPSPLRGVGIDHTSSKVRWHPHLDLDARNSRLAPPSTSLSIATPGHRKSPSRHPRRSNTPPRPHALCPTLFSLRDPRPLAASPPHRLPQRAAPPPPLRPFSPILPTHRPRPHPARLTLHILRASRRLGHRCSSPSSRLSRRHQLYLPYFRIAIRKI